MDYYAIGQRIRKFRKAQNLSQEALAEQANISTTHISHIETGNTKLSLQVFADLAAALHVSADDLLFDVAAVSLAEKYRAAVREARLCAGNRGAARSGHAGADADSDRHRPRRQAGHGQVSPLTQKPICVKIPASAQDDVDIVPYAGFEIL